jgi:hypothetical protein
MCAYTPAWLQDSKAEQDKSAATQAELAGRVDPLPADAINAALQRQVAGGATAAAPTEVRSAPIRLPAYLPACLSPSLALPCCRRCS